MKGGWSIRQLSAIATVVVALLSGTYYLLKLRQECGELPLFTCVQTHAFSVRRPTTEEAADKEAKDTAEQLEWERRKAEERARAAEARTKAVEAARLAAQAAAKRAEEKERAAEEAERKTLENKRAREEADRLARLSEDKRRAAEAEKRAADYESEIARNRLRAAEETRKQAETQRAALAALQPRHRYWSTSYGGVYEYRQTGSTITLILVRPSAEAAQRGAVPGTTVFVGVHDGAGNSISGRATGFGRPGCSYQVPATLIIQPDQLIEQVEAGPAACGFMRTRSATVTFHPTR